VGRDARLILLAKTARTFCYGFLGVLLPVYLTQLGLDATELGLAVTLTLLASTAMTFAIRWPAERWSPRVALMAQSALIVASAALFLSTHHPWLVVLAAMIGNLAVGTGETGPFLALEQVIVTRATPRERLTMTLSLYNLTGYAAAGLGAAAVARAGASPRLLFALFLLSGLLQLAAYGLMASAKPASAAVRQAAGAPSRPFVRRLAAIFALDSFAGGFVVQAFVAYWFSREFDTSPATLGIVFFSVGLLQAFSFAAAVRLAGRIGLVPTMVFTHLPSNVLLAAIPFAPSEPAAIALLLGRFALSQMDVPARQAFVVGVVEPDERTAAAAYTNTARYVTRPFAPLVAAPLAAAWLGAPFVVAGALKSCYDVALYALFGRADPGDATDM
jgi:predicted MFS family arabinose efflux permease